MEDKKRKTISFTNCALGKRVTGRLKYMTEEQKTLKVCVEAVRKRLFMAVYAPKALLAEVEAAVKECRNEIL